MKNYADAFVFHMNPAGETAFADLSCRSSNETFSEGGIYESRGYALRYNCRNIVRKKIGEK